MSKTYDNDIVTPQDELLGVAANRVMRMSLNTGDHIKTWRYSTMKVFIVYFPDALINLVRWWDDFSQVRQLQSPNFFNVSTVTSLRLQRLNSRKGFWIFILAG